MTTFLFIVAPIICEGIYIIHCIRDYGYYSETPLLLIPFGLYIASVIIVRNVADLFKKKVLCFFLFLIFPLVSLFMVSALTTEWYDIGYKKIKSNAQVYLYNEDSEEVITSINFKPVSYDETFIDTYFDKAQGYNSLYSPVSFTFRNNTLKQNELQRFKIRPGKYTVKIDTYLKEQKKEYTVETNFTYMDAAKAKNVYLCFDGANLFMVNPDQEDEESVKTLYFSTDNHIYKAKWDKQYLMDEDQHKSNKKEKK
jgi:hypothetical protein